MGQANTPEIVPMTKDHLKAAIDQGPQNLQNFLKGKPDAPRADQLKRAREAIAIMKKDLPDLVDEKKKQVVNASKEIVQSALNDVTTELQKGVAGRLEQLQGEQKELLETREAILQEERALAKTLPEQTVQKGTEIVQDIKEGGMIKRVAYGGAILVGALGLPWLWSKIESLFWGSENKPGFIRKTMRVLLGIVGAVGGAWLTSKFFRTKFGGGFPAVLEKAGAAAEKGTKTLKDTIKRLENFGSNTKELIDRSDKGEDIKPQEWAVAIAKDGGHLVWEGGVMHLYNSAKVLIPLEGKFMSELVDAATGKPNWGEIIAVYVEGAVVYGTSFAAIDVYLGLRAGKGVFKSLRQGAFAAGTWPYQVFKKVGGAKVGEMAFDITVGQLLPGRQMRQARVMATYRAPGYHLNRITTPWKSATPELLEARVGEWNMWSGMSERAKGNEGLVKLLDGRKEKIAGDVKKILIDLEKQGGAEAALEKLGRGFKVTPDLGNQLKAASISKKTDDVKLDLVKKWLTESAPDVSKKLKAANAEGVTNVPVGKAPLTNTAVEATRTARTGEALATTLTGERLAMVKRYGSLTPLLDDAKFAEHMNKMLNAKNIDHAFYLRTFDTLASKLKTDVQWLRGAPKLELFEEAIHVLLTAKTAASAQKLTQWGKFAEAAGTARRGIQVTKVTEPVYLARIAKIAARL